VAVDTSAGSAGARDDERGWASAKMRPLRFDALDSLLVVLDMLDIELLRE
jgi:hypothetical protein